jgi:hypothetical protein
VRRKYSFLPSNAESLSFKVKRNRKKRRRQKKKKKSQAMWPWMSRSTTSLWRFQKGLLILLRVEKALCLSLDTGNSSRRLGKATVPVHFAACCLMLFCL